MAGDIHAFQAQTVVIGIGNSLIQGFTVVAGLVSVVVKYGSGGSLEFGGPTLRVGNGYLFDTGEALSFDIRGNFYLAATGATVTAYIIKGKSAGFEP